MSISPYRIAASRPRGAETVPLERRAGRVLVCAVWALMLYGLYAGLRGDDAPRAAHDVRGAGPPGAVTVASPTPMTTHARDVAKDEALHTRRLEQACGLQEAAACRFAGSMHEHGVARDLARALAYYRMACERGHAAGCYDEAIMYDEGRGVPEDDRHALALYAKACELGSKVACSAARRR